MTKRFVFSLAITIAVVAAASAETWLPLPSFWMPRKEAGLFQRTLPQTKPVASWATSESGQPATLPAESSGCSGSPAGMGCNGATSARVTYATGCSGSGSASSCSGSSTSGRQARLLQRLRQARLRARSGR